MSKRRSNDEGTIYEAPEGSGIWYAQLPRGPDGKRPKRRASSQKEALAKLRDLQKSRSKGLNLTSKMPTLEALAQSWLSDIAKRRVKDGSLGTYESEIARYIVPVLGAYRVDKVTTPLLQRHINDMTDDGYSLSIIKQTRGKLIAILDLALDYSYILINPARAVKLPRIAPRPARPLTRDEWATVYAALERYGLALLFRLCIQLGLRRGEALGASWRGLDWQAGTLSIDQQQNMVRGKRVLNPTTKSESGKRKIPLPPLLVADLRALWEAQQAQRRAMGTDWKEHGLIVCKANGEPYSPSYVSNLFADTLARIGVAPARVHDLRHTCASLLGEQGTLPHVIAAILGHSPKSITEYYTHATIDSMRIALTTLESSLCEKSQQKAEG